MNESFEPRPVPRPRSGLSKDQTRASLRLFSWSATFRGVFDTMCGGTTIAFVAFGRSLGIAREQMGWLSALISAACLVQMFAVPLSARARDRKRFVLKVALAEPVLFIAAVAVIPFLMDAARPWIFAAAVFAAAAFVNLSRPLLEDWVAAVVPAGIRGRYISRQTQAYSISMILSTLAAGLAIQHIGLHNTRGLALILIVGGLCAVLAVRALRCAQMPVTRPAVAASRGWPVLLRNRWFRRCLIFSLLYNVPFYFSCPYYQVFNLEVIGMPPGKVALMQTGYFLVKILTLPAIGRLSERWGARRTVAVAGVVYALFFASFPFCRLDRHWPVMVAWAVVALADAAYWVAFRMSLYGSLPHGGARPMYFAVLNILSLFLFGVGGLIAVPVLHALKDLHLSLGILEIESFQAYYAGCAVLMVPCIATAALLPGRRLAAP